MPLPVSTREAGVTVPAATVEPMGGIIADIIVSLISIAILSSFMTQRFLVIKDWRKLPLVVWLVFAIFIDSFLFVFITAILKHGVGINSSFSLCSSAILLCLICYVTTKIMIYMFLVEKAFIVRNGTKPRMKSKLYLFNSFGMLSIYLVVSILNFIFRITRMEDGLCIIGMKKIAMIPLITFDLLVNIYLTTLFLIPLRCLYSFKDMQRTSANIRLRTIAMRTFVGAASTTISSVVNLTVLMALDGEPGWVCLLCCNLDILFSAVMIQWVTSRDNAATATTSDPKNSHVYPRESMHNGTSNGNSPGSGGIHKSISTTQKYMSADDMEAGSYPLQHTGAFRSAETLDDTKFGGSRGRSGSLDQVSTTSLVENTERVHDRTVVGVVETVIVGGKLKVTPWGTENSQKQHK